jgi:uncharacterized membrane protein
MTRFARSAGISTPAILTAPLWLPFFLAVVLLMFGVLLIGLTFATAALWLDTLANYLLEAASDAADDLDAWFIRMTGWRA